MGNRASLSTQLGSRRGPNVESVPFAETPTGYLAPPLPSNFNAERCVLGAILLDNQALNVATEKLGPEDFFHDHHRRIFSEMIAMHEVSMAIDLVTLSDELRRHGQLESSGGEACLAALVDGVPHVSNVEHYARIIKKASVLRNLIHATQAIQQAALEGEDDVDAILDRAAESIAELRKDAAKESELLVYTAQQLAALAPKPVEYVVYPLAARGIIALLDGAAKAAGKTTLIFTGVRASLREETFLDRTTMRARVLYVSEENPRTLHLGLERAGLVDQKDLYFLPLTSFAGMPWPQLVRHIEQLCMNLKITWLILDTFYAVAGLGGEEENKAGAVDAAIAPIRAIVGKLDIAVTLSRHERKSGGEVGKSGRGSSALTGAADSVLRLKRHPGSQSLARRNLEVTGRIEQANLDIELRNGRYNLLPNDGGKLSADGEGEKLGKAIQEDPKASIRKLASVTGIGRNRIVKLAKEAGWIKGHDGWKRGSG